MAYCEFQSIFVNIEFLRIFYIINRAFLMCGWVAGSFPLHFLLISSFCCMPYKGVYLIDKLTDRRTDQPSECVTARATDRNN